MITKNTSCLFLLLFLQGCGLFPGLDTEKSFKFQATVENRTDYVIRIDFRLPNADNWSSCTPVEAEIVKRIPPQTTRTVKDEIKCDESRSDELRQEIQYVILSGEAGDIFNGDSFPTSKLRLVCEGESCRAPTGD